MYLTPDISLHEVFPHYLHVHRDRNGSIRDKLLLGLGNPSSLLQDLKYFNKVISEHVLTPAAEYIFAIIFGTRYF